MPRNISRCLFSGYLVVHHINSLTYCGCFVSLCRYLCFKKFFLHWWFGVIGYKWKSRKWERFLPHSCACFLYTESFQILLSYLLYSICVVLKKNPKSSKLLSSFSTLYTLNLYVSQYVESFYTMCSKAYF